MASARGRLDDTEALREATLVLRANLAAAGVQVENPELIVSRVVSAYLPIYNRLRSRSLKWSEASRQMAAMKPGDKLTISARSVSALHERMRSARELSDNPLASWTTTRLSDHSVVVRRLQDGQPPPRRMRSSVTLALAAMKPGESRVVIPAGQRNARISTTYYSDNARRYMESETAHWSFKTTTKGLRATREA